MADLPPPETLRKPTGDVVNVNSTQGLNTISVGGKTYNILDVGYTCGNVACTVMSEYTCLFSPPPFCNVCASCWHIEGIVPVPDYASCGISAGQYGILVKFKPAWICHCLKLLGFASVNVNLIQPVGTTPYCGAPSVPPPLHNFNPFPIVAGAAVGALAVGAIAAGGGFSGSGGSAGGSGASGGSSGATGGTVASGGAGATGSGAAGGAGASGVAGNTTAASSATLPSGEIVSFDSDGGGKPYRPGIDVDIDYLPQHPSGTLSNFSGCPDTQPENNSSEDNTSCSPTAPENAIILTLPARIA
jgi:hypothetical protein